MWWDICKWSIVFFLILLAVIVTWIVSTLFRKPVDSLGCHAPTELGFPMIVRRKDDGLYQVIISCKRRSHDGLIERYGCYSLISEGPNCDVDGETKFPTKHRAATFLDEPFVLENINGVQVPNKIYSEYRNDANALYFL